MQDREYGPARVVVVGDGPLALRLAAATYRSPQAEVAAFAGVPPAPGADWRQERFPGLRRFARVADVPAGGFDAAIVCGSGAERRAATEVLLRLGMPVLSAGTVAERPADAERLLALAGERELHLCSALPLRRTFASSLRALRDGRLGPVTSVRQAWRGAGAFAGLPDGLREASEALDLVPELLAGGLELLGEPASVVVEATGGPASREVRVVVKVDPDPVWDVGRQTLTVSVDPTRAVGDHHALLVDAAGGILEASGPTRHTAAEAAEDALLPKLWAPYVDGRERLAPSLTLLACDDVELAAFLAGVRAGRPLPPEAAGRELRLVRVLAAAGRSARTAHAEPL